MNQFQEKYHRLKDKFRPVDQNPQNNDLVNQTNLVNRGSFQG